MMDFAAARGTIRIFVIFGWAVVGIGTFLAFGNLAKFGLPGFIAALSLPIAGLSVVVSAYIGIAMMYMAEATIEIRDRIRRE